MTNRAIANAEFPMANVFLFCGGKMAALHCRLLTSDFRFLISSLLPSPFFEINHIADRPDIFSIGKAGFFLQPFEHR